MSKKIFIACDTNKTSIAKKIIEQSGHANIEMINDYNGDIRVLKVMKC